MTVFQKSFRFKFVVSCVIMITLVIALILVVIYTVTKDILEDQIGSSAREVAVAAAYLVMDDTEAYPEIEN